MRGLGDKINTSDKVYFDNKPINMYQKKIYILLNKPIGYVTTLSDEYNRPQIMDLIPIKERIVPVGRLDMYTSRSNYAN